MKRRLGMCKKRTRNAVCKGFVMSRLDFYVVIGSTPHILRTPFCMTFGVEFPHKFESFTWKGLIHSLPFIKPVRSFRRERKTHIINFSLSGSGKYNSVIPSMVY